MNKAFSLFLISLLLIGCMSEKHRFKNTIESKGALKLGFWERMGLMKRVFFNEGDRAPKKKLPQVKADLHLFTDKQEHLKFIWFGHSTILLNIDGRNVLMDPIFSDTASPFSFMVKRFQPPALSLQELPEIDLIIISHDHYDHLDKETIKFFAEKKTQFITATGVGQHLQNWGIAATRITELGWHQSIEKMGLRLTATPAQHFSGRTLFDTNSTLWASWVVESKKDKIYFSGDSGYSDHFRDIGEKYGPFDIAFLENGQYNDLWPDVHLHPQQTIAAMKDLRAQAFVPIHWAMFSLSFHQWDEPIIRTYQLAQEQELRIITPKLGEMVDSNHQQSFTAWWQM